MKLAKAIELSKETEKSLRDHKFIDHADAVKLGYKAMQRLQACREPEGGNPLPPLEGEDEK